MSKVVKIIVAVVICLLVGYASGMATQSSIETWYPTLIKPVFNPPNWLFGPVWTILYTMMGVSAGLIWAKKNQSPDLVKNALLLFSIQLILNAVWSFLFFGLNNTLLAFIEIILLGLLIFETIKKFKPIDTLAAKLMIPYLLWVSFATILNGSIWWLNR